MAGILGEEQARGLTLVADYQDHGSGRKGRAWLAPPGSALLCTIGLPDAIPVKDLWVVPFWTGLVVADALADVAVRATLQWPNDALVNGRKIAGILCISRVTGEYAWAGCGIGINVHRPANPALTEPIQPPPAYVSDVAHIDREQLLEALLRNAEECYDDLAFPERVIRAWDAAAGLPGARYRILIDGESEPFEAKALRLLPGGALLIEHEGRQREIALADARVLRD